MNSGIGLTGPRVENSFRFPRAILPSPLISEGTLVYYDAMDISNPIPEGVIPPAGGTVPNLALNAVNLVGDPTAGYFGVASTVAENSRIERTAKGAIHVAFKQGAGGGTQTYHFTNPAIRSYYNTYRDHSYLLSLVGRPTQAPTNNSTAVQPNQRWAGTALTSGDFMTIRAGSSATILTAAPNTNRIVSDQPSYDIGEALFCCGAWSSLVEGELANNFGIIVWTNGGNNSPSGSHIIYNVFLEDLTVSGRDATDVRDMLYAHYEEMFSPDGAYYDDSWTDPSTLP